MKKIFSTLFVLFAGMTAFAQDATLTVDDVTLAAGETATVTLNVTNATNYIGAGMYINLPEGFTFVYDDEEELYAIGGDVFAKSHDVADKLQKENVLKFVITSMKNAAFKNDEGSLVETTITCGADQAAGKYAKFSGGAFSYGKGIPRRPVFYSAGECFPLLQPLG